jgi:hypothetical protein
MSGENPFAQWGYQHPLAVTDHDKPASPTSIFGALPSGLSNYGFPMGFSTGDNTQPSAAAAAAAAASNQSALAQMQITTIRFVSPTNSVLNSTVMGPQGQKFFTVATHGVGNTVLVNEQASGATRGEAVGTIEWQRTPFVSLVGAVARQSAGQWLAWSSDRKYRTMMARGREYNWVFNTGMFFVSPPCLSFSR